MVDVPVNGDVLKWARELRGYSEDDAAELLGIEVAGIQSLESGQTKPNLGELKSMASKYDIALASLLMPAPLVVTKRVTPDHRTFDGVAPTKLSRKLQKVLDEVDETIELLIDLQLTSMGSLPARRQLPHVHRRTPAARVAADERARIGPSVAVQMNCQTDREAFLRFRSAIEAQGVFVHVINFGETDHCRGVSIIDDREIPFIIINGFEDSYRAKSFSLLHEYAHILLRNGGLSDENHSSAIEKYCNEFAAYFLLPRDEFLRQFEALAGTNEASEWHVSRLATIFRVSQSAVALQLEELGRARPGFYNRLRSLWSSRPKQKKGQARATHVEKLANRLGIGFITTVTTAQERGFIDKADVFELTKAKPQYVQSLLQEVNARQAAYGAA